MNTLFFWNTWQRKYRLFYLFLLGLFALSIIWFVIEYFTAQARIYPIDKQTNVNSHILTWHKFNKGIFELSIEGENFIVEERFEPQAFSLAYYPPFILGIFLVVVLIVLLTIASTLGIVWYAASMTLFVFFISQLRLDYLGLLKNVHLYAGTIVIILAFLPVSFYFQIRRHETQFFNRLAIFALITLGCVLLFFLTSRIKEPTWALVNFGSAIPLLISFVFITIVAHEIPLALLTLVQKYSADSGPHNLVHFTIAVLIYLANLGLIYLKQNGYWEGNITYIDTFWFYLVAVVLGIWGYHKRSVLIENIMPFAPQGAYFYLAGAVLTTATMAYHFALANDAMLDALNDMILFSFLGFGVGFYIYVLINFGQMIKLNYKVLDLLYQGKVLAFWTVRYFGFGLTFILYLSINQYTYYQTVAGYYNLLADATLQNKDVLLAQKYYEISKANDYYNHKANYALSLLAEQQKDYKNMMLYLLEAVKRQNVEHTFLKISKLYDERNLFYEALSNLQEGLKSFPKSWAMLNNLALLHAKNKALDSAFAYLEKAEKIAKNEPTIQNNMWALLAKNPTKNIKLEEILKPKDLAKTDNLVALVNQIALYNAYQADFPEISQIEKLLSNLPNNEIGLALVHNYTLNKLGKKDKTAEMLLAHFEKIDKDRNFAYSLNFIKANYLYFSGNTTEGIKLLAAMPVMKSESYYNTVISFWLMQQNADVLAIPYLEKALELGNSNALFYKAIALSEINDIPLAQDTWKELLQAKNKSIQDFAKRILPILSEEKTPETDWEKYNFIRYKRLKADTQKLLDLAETIQDVNFKNWAKVLIADIFLAKNQTLEAQKLYETLVPSPTAQPFIQSEVNLIYCRLLLAQNEPDKLLAEIDKLVFTFPYNSQKNYLKALAFEAKNDMIEAEKYYLQAVQTTPYNELAILNVARFYQNYKKDADKAYHFLVEGVRLNPFSIPIIKQYALQALEIGLDYYGDDAMNRLQELTTKEDFDKAVEIYEQAKKRLLEKRMAKTP
ncbi:MAG: hypothetical protein NZ551_06980 [Microscillaceae bacterium]|nr:hypothetical protein [Microscillaceae bacterium]MDW8460936.1 hypothetical protein [Cytophagales bacterium]